MMNSLIHTWQHLPEHINPIVFQIGFFQLRYYGLMYALSFIVVYVLIMWRIKHDKFSFKRQIVEDCFFWGLTGAVIGARIGYVLFYNFSYFVQYPLQIILPFDPEQGWAFVGISGLSYHGGLVGVIAALSFFCRKHKIDVWELSRLIIPAAPLGYMFGRLGNFLNGELYGRVTTSSIGMYFPQAPTWELRHPSQLYEMVFEGFFLFLILWFLRNRKIFKGFFLSLYLIGYGTVRFVIEYYREPDEQLGLLLMNFSMGQWLCLVMIAVGGFLMAWGYSKGVRFESK